MSIVESQFAGAQVTDSTGECVGLTLESIQNIKPESGHGLMYKNVVQEQTKDNLDASKELVKTLELFQSPVQVSYWWYWRIHNLYGIISAIEVALTFPTGSWGGITLNLANDVKDGPSITYDRVPIHIKLIEDTTMALVDDWYNGSWATNFVTTYPKPSLTGVTSKIKLVVQDGSIKGLFDDEEWFVFSDRHHFEPKIIKQFFIHVYAGGVALVHNVTLFGTCN